MNIFLPALVAAVVSIPFGSVAAALISHFLTSARADKEYRLRKLEEMFTAAESAVRNLRTNIHYNLQVAVGSTTWQALVEKKDQTILNFQAEYATALMLSKIYFPDLAFVIERLREIEKDTHTQKKAFGGVYIPRKNFPEFASVFTAAIEELERRRQDIREKLVEAATIIRQGWLRSWIESR